MTTQSHTPGPFYIVTYTILGDEIYDTETGPTIGYDNCEYDWAVSDEEGLEDFAPDETRTNVKSFEIPEDLYRLIAAAPKMLRALEMIVNSDMAMREEDEGEISTELSIAREAITAATSGGKDE